MAAAASDVLHRVDKLTVTIVVDNSVEWMAKLPPGFSGERDRHLVDQKPPVDPLTGVPILDFEHWCCGAHGFSALIETEVTGTGTTPQRHLTLFDTGPDSRTIARNADALQLPLASIDRVVLSHWHSDHTGGLLSFLDKRARAVQATHTPDAAAISAAAAAATAATSTAAPIVVDAHPNRPTARGIAPGPAYDRVVGRLPEDPRFDAIEGAGARVEKHARAHTVAGGTVYVSGEIPRVTAFEAGLPGGMRWVDAGAEWVAEPGIMDERYAAIDVAGKGLVVFSACSHAGIVNVLKDAVATLNRPVYMVVGGLHLVTPDLQPRIQPTMDFLSTQLVPAPTYVLPMHCTGFAARIALEATFGEGCVPAGVGTKVVLEGDRDADKRMMEPVIRPSA